MAGKAQSGEEILAQLMREGGKGSGKAQEQIAAALAAQQAEQAKLDAEQKALKDEVKAEKEESKKTRKSILTKKDIKEIFDDLYTKAENKRKSNEKKLLKDAFKEMYDDAEKEKQRNININQASQPSNSGQSSPINTNAVSDDKREKNETKFSINSLSGIMRENNQLIREQISLQTRSLTILSDISQAIKGMNVGGGINLPNPGGASKKRVRPGMNTRTKVGIGLGAAAAVGAGAYYMMSGDKEEEDEGTFGGGRFNEESDTAVPTDITPKPSVSPAQPSTPVQAPPPSSTGGKATTAGIAETQSRGEKLKGNLNFDSRNLTFKTDKLVFEVGQLTIDAKSVKKSEIKSVQAKSQTSVNAATSAGGGAGQKPGGAGGAGGSGAAGSAPGGSTGSSPGGSSSSPGASPGGAPGGSPGGSPSGSNDTAAITGAQGAPPGSNQKWSELTDDQKNKLLDNQARAEGATKAGTLPNRMNNPGAILVGKGKGVPEWAKAFGAELGQSNSVGTLLKFPDMEAGRKAQKALWDRSYSNLTLSQATAKWVTGNPNGAAPAHYLSALTSGGVAKKPGDTAQKVEGTPPGAPGAGPAGAVRVADAAPGVQTSNARMDAADREDMVQGAQLTAGANVNAITGPMAKMMAAKEAAEAADAKKPKPNTFIEGEAPQFDAMGSVTVPGTGRQEFVGGGRGDGAAEVAARKAAAIPAPEKVVKPKPQTKTIEVDDPNWDRHAKSRAMFQAHQDAERRGEDTHAMFFAADRQRTLELGMKAPKIKKTITVAAEKVVPLPPRRPEGLGEVQGPPEENFQQKRDRETAEWASDPRRAGQEHAKSITATAESNAARDEEENARQAKLKAMRIDEGSEANTAAERQQIENDDEIRKKGAAGQPIAQQIAEAPVNGVQRPAGTLRNAALANAGSFDVEGNREAAARASAREGDDRDQGKAYSSGKSDQTDSETVDPGPGTAEHIKKFYPYLMMDSNGSGMPL